MQFLRCWHAYFEIDDAIRPHPHFTYSVTRKPLTPLTYLQSFSPITFAVPKICMYAFYNAVPTYSHWEYMGNQLGQFGSKLNGNHWIFTFWSNTHERTRGTALLHATLSSVFCSAQHAGVTVGSTHVDSTHGKFDTCRIYCVEPAVCRTYCKHHRVMWSVIAQCLL